MKCDVRSDEGQGGRAWISNIYDTSMAASDWNYGRRVHPVTVAALPM